MYELSSYHRDAHSYLCLSFIEVFSILGGGAVFLLFLAKQLTRR